MKFNLEHLKNSLIAQSQRNEVVANNLANLKSNGFKRDVVFFEALTEAQKPEFDMIVSTDFQQGHLNQTDNPLDFAITGSGFFELETPDGMRYARDGHFQFNESGVLVNNDGHKVMGLEGPITAPINQLGAGLVRVNEGGEVFFNDERIGQFNIVSFENPQQLQKAGGNAFYATPGAVKTPESESLVRQGFIESANVNPVEEMVELIEIQRQFESMQRMVQTLDNTFRTAAEQVGRYQ